MRSGTYFWFLQWNHSFYFLTCNSKFLLKCDLVLTLPITFPLVAERAQCPALHDTHTNRQNTCKNIFINLTAHVEHLESKLQIQTKQNTSQCFQRTAEHDMDILGAMQVVHYCEVLVFLYLETWLLSYTVWHIFWYIHHSTQRAVLWPSPSTWIFVHFHLFEFFY